MYEALYYQPTWVLYLRGAPVYLHLYLCLYLNLWWSYYLSLVSLSLYYLYSVSSPYVLQE